jgi:rhodanese-related sulfurtransferase
MSDDVRITIEELRKRMQAGEEFRFIDTRNPQAWAQSDVMLPQALRVPLESFEKYLQEIPKNKPLVTYCT